MRNSYQPLWKYVTINNRHGFQRSSPSWHVTVTTLVTVTSLVTVTTLVTTHTIQFITITWEAKRVRLMIHDSVLIQYLTHFCRLETGVLLPPPLLQVRSPAPFFPPAHSRFGVHRRRYLTRTLMKIDLGWNQSFCQYPKPTRVPTYTRN